MAFNEGDQVYQLAGAWRDTITKAVVARVTKTQAIMVNSRGQESRYNRETGREVGASGYSASRIEHPDEHLDRMYTKRRSEALAGKVSEAARLVARGEEEARGNLREAILLWDTFDRENLS